MEKITIKKLTAKHFAYVAEKVNWFCPHKNVIKKALKNSQFRYAVFIGSSLVGMARVVSDHATFFCIRDFAIIPSYQKRGIGLQLLNKIICDVKHKNSGSPCMMEIQCSLGTEGFYQKVGFKIRPNSGNGPAMYMLLNSNRENAHL